MEARPIIAVSTSGLGLGMHGAGILFGGAGVSLDGLRVRQRRLDLLEVVGDGDQGRLDDPPRLSGAALGLARGAADDALGVR